MPPRILFLDHVGVLGGAELSLIDIAAHFRAQSTVVLFADGPLRKRLEEKGVSVVIEQAQAGMQAVSREGGRWEDLRSIPGVVGLVWRIVRRARGFEVLYANSQKSFVVGALAGYLGRKPVVWHLRDLLTPAHFSPSHRQLVVWLANRLATQVVANSEATAAAFREAGGQAGKVCVVHNSIDATPFQSPEADPAGVREALGIAPGVPLVGVFSRLSPWKGQDVLLEALAALPGWEALLVGEALFGEVAFAASLREQARRLKVEERVHFLGFRKDIPALMQAVDVVAHTSVAPEPFGRVVVEGMLAGKPVVATAAGGVPEILKHEETGWLVPPGDAAALVRVLQQIRAQPSSADAVAAAGQADAVARFSLPRLFKELDALLSEISPPT